MLKGYNIAWFHLYRILKSLDYSEKDQLLTEEGKEEVKILLYHNNECTLKKKKPIHPNP